MFEYILKTLPRILFEPVSVAALLGILLYLFLHWKRKDYRFCLICTAVFFLLGWRIAAYSIMASKRYSEILIYPGIVFTCYFCLQFPVFLRWFLRKTKLSCFPHFRIICRYLPYFCIAGIAIACLTKAFYINTYSGYIVYLCDIFNKDTSGRNPVYLHSCSKETGRIVYYCNIERKYFSDHQIDPKEDSSRLFVEYVHMFDNIPGTHYFFRSKNNNEKELLPSDLDLKPENWQEVSREYSSRKKTKELILYRYIPLCTNIQEWSAPIPEPSKSKNMILYDLETSNRRTKIDLLAHCAGHETECKKEVLLPSGWGLDYDLKLPVKLPVITVSELSPLTGKKSLQLSSYPGEQQAWIYSVPFAKKNYSFSLFVRGDAFPTSKFVISIRGKQTQSSSYPVKIKRLYFNLKKNKTYRIHWDISSKDFPIDSDSFIMSIGVTNGAVSLDQFEIHFL